MPISVFLAAVALSQPVAAQAADDYAALFTRSTDMINRMFYDASRKDEKVRTFAKYKDIAGKAASREEFGEIMNRMIEEFNDSHFAFLGNDEQGYYTFDGLQKSLSANGINAGAAMPHIGAWFRRDGNRYFVQMIVNGGEAERAGLRKGDELLTVDGGKFKPIRPFEGAIGKEVMIGYRRGTKEAEVKVKVNSEPALRMFLNASRNSRRVIEQGGKRLGYFHLWTQSSEDFITATHSAVASLQDTDAFILDLRDGFGGRPERYADPFFRPGTKLEWTTGGATQTQYYGYSKPLIVLINEGSRSAKEVLSYILKSSGRATLVGRTTAGAVLGTTPLRLNDWAFLEIPMVRLKVDGQTLEDKGVDPDIAVKDEFDATGKDLILEKGIETALSKLK
ncbi:MAG: PDZ domain-containing protein [Chthonomonas sp.]|nr:PDZ domain-containing protein [Chthonomonas sp.]